MARGLILLQAFSTGRAGHLFVGSATPFIPNQRQATPFQKPSPAYRPLLTPFRQLSPALPYLPCCPLPCLPSLISSLPS
jgi:hypothetical protein